MEKINVQNCLFHGIRDGEKKDAISILEDIFTSGSLLTHDSLRQKGIVHEREIYSHQGSNAISICFHPHNLELFEKFKDTCIVLKNIKPAFVKYVNVSKPSIIFNQDLLNKLKYRQFGGYKRTVDEIQILGDIPLSYMEAIGFNLEGMTLEEQKHILETLSNLLKKYQYDVPIINPNNGTCYKKNK